MSFFGCRLNYPLLNLILSKQPSSYPLAALTRSQIRFYSTNGDDNDDVSNKELKRRIQKFLDGDEDAMPSIFEGILKRKLSGKHEESDDELMKEIRGEWKQPLDDADDLEFDSDLTDSSGTDGD
ncbi:hypothetical protein ERO13_A07G059300v2 [Gossypium hirsutum]|uniref:Uncharacterized protein n=4 Tax=Gossypium TaxID=3633 RepID=A0ABR0P9F1_GOSAR|nr:uncharacterized protein LOC107926661 [Gossypium hirsutum]XP_017645051.1 uncharacterized protein LOC108485712 [Gossypium arboreum]TYI18125.1 hypothetical protein ES332_A07G069600v1 [Gossypium tomentosum]TYJ25704.1 hypothetical protein E1A91_A07G067600v1 [Gossypium mustelinum]KAG4190916.1 hypothetical protein ERO13_A07G059300v2 [Gossypium hirsutum]KAK5817810.1 hypothetical protein PVK06_022738 [Gossypium arboreum]